MTKWQDELRTIKVKRSHKEESYKAIEARIATKSAKKWPIPALTAIVMLALLIIALPMTPKQSTSDNLSVYKVSYKANQHKYFEAGSALTYYGIKSTTNADVIALAKRLINATEEVAPSNPHYMYDIAAHTNQGQFHYRIVLADDNYFAINQQTHRAIAITYNDQYLFYKLYEEGSSLVVVLPLLLLCLQGLAIVMIRKRYGQPNCRLKSIKLDFLYFVLAISVAVIMWSTPKWLGFTVLLLVVVGDIIYRRQYFMKHQANYSVHLQQLVTIAVRLMIIGVLFFYL
ncbi:MAG TPA: hypothetical protein K8V30_01500 [Metalysinibacillus jejuensis]|uniref:Uncharacterized protein n=1 Tax=Metalysinibacillus jejuensis TaxID=914327 RepID=A0A921NB72_9BACL|nr:hypothetical protein [Metalysinibacillus jejuensis]